MRGPKDGVGVPSGYASTLAVMEYLGGVDLGGPTLAGVDALGRPCGDIRSTTGVPQTATELAASR
jgi:hypothetical protein